MAKRQRTAQTKRDQKRQRRAAPSAAEKADEISVLTTKTNNRLTQSAQLGDSQLQSAQRQALATQIGQAQGNQHLQSIIPPRKPGELTTVLQMSLQEFDSRRQRVGIASGHPIEPLPTNPQDRQEGGLYYDDSDPNLEAMCVREASAQRADIQGHNFIIGYPRYRIYFRLGRRALWRSEGGQEVAVPDQELLAMYRHERVHQRQYQAMRRADVEIARQNSEHYDAIGRFTSQEEITRHLSGRFP